MKKKLLTLAEILERNGGTLPPLAGCDPAAEEVTLDDVAQSVAQLRSAVEDAAEGRVDEDTVRRIAAEVLENSAAEGRNRRRRDFDADDVDGDVVERGLRGDHQERMLQIHGRSARVVAGLIESNEEEVRDFQERADNLVLLGALLRERGQVTDLRETRYFAEEYMPALRAMDTQTATEGLEFVPRNLSNQLIERVSLDLMVLALFPSIDMPTNPFDIPGRGVSRKRGGTLAENTADTGQTGAKKVTPASRLVTLTAKKFTAEGLVSKEAQEDSIIAMLPFIQEELVDYLAFDQEDAAVNGDLTGTHQDADVTSADDPRKAWKGLRKLAPAGAKADGANAALQTTHLLTNRKNMGKYGARPRDLAHIVSTSGLVQLLTDPAVQTIDKYGVNATVLSGELAKAHGVPVIGSEAVRLDLNASGVNDGVTTNRTEAITCHRRGVVVGNRRETSVQVLRELYAEYDQDAILVTLRKALSARFPTTEAIVALTYNLAT